MLTVYLTNSDASSMRALLAALDYLGALKVTLSEPDCCRVAFDEIFLGLVYEAAFSSEAKSSTETTVSAT